MSTDTWRLHYTYLIALLVLVGCFVLLLLPTGDVTGSDKLTLITFVAGIVLGFVFNRESTVAGARAAERAVAQGSAGGLTAEQVTAATGGQGE